MGIPSASAVGGSPLTDPVVAAPPSQSSGSSTPRGPFKERKRAAKRLFTVKDETAPFEKRAVLRQTSARFTSFSSKKVRLAVGATTIERGSYRRASREWP